MFPARTREEADADAISAQERNVQALQEAERQAADALREAEEAAAAAAVAPTQVQRVAVFLHPTQAEVDEVLAGFKPDGGGIGLLAKAVDGDGGIGNRFVAAETELGHSAVSLA